MNEQSPRCLVCGNESFSTTPDYHNDLLKCNKCGFVFYKLIADDEINYVYDENYYEGRYYNYLADKKVTQKNFTNRLKVIKKYCSTGKLLEIGCAYGFFLELANKYFDVHGIDVAEAGVKYARDVIGLSNVKAGNYLAEYYPENSFDVISMFDTIEHLKLPNLFVEKAVKELKKGGLLCLTTGDIGSRMAQLQKKNWRLIYPPEHQVYFSIYSMKYLLERSGLELVNVSHPGYNRSLAMMLYLTIFKNNKIIGSSSLFKVLQKIPVYLNLYDIMFVIARKK
jgi:SAM-dependent methyltransferase